MLPDVRLLAAFPETTRFCRVLDPEIDAPEMEEIQTRVHTATRRKDIVLRATEKVANQVFDRLPNRATDKATGGRADRIASDGSRTDTLPRQCQVHDGDQRYGAGDGQPAARQPPGSQELADRIFQECREWFSSRRANWDGQRRRGRSCSGRVRHWGGRGPLPSCAGPPRSPCGP